jgi:hypothetical protein
MEKNPMKIVISSGHSLKVRGAAGPKPWGLDEVDEARRVVAEIANFLKLHGHDAIEFHDDTSTSQDQNLHTIVNFHNAQGAHDLDVSVHFNAYTPTSGGRGTECLYVSQADLANNVAMAIAGASGLINRGPKKRTDLYFLNKTNQPAILIEVCFVDAQADVEAYDEHFTEICQAIGNAIAPSEEEDALSGILRARGAVSWFGGPEDDGVSPSEGLAFIYDIDDKPHLFLKQQPAGTTGLARRLDPNKHYIAMRWDYDQFSKDRLAGEEVALVRAPSTGKHFTAHPADWGPHSDTARVADISPGLMAALGIETDDEVEVIYPFRRDDKA